jgi:hypothetical protein
MITAPYVRGGITVSSLQRRRQPREDEGLDTVEHGNHARLLDDAVDAVDGS